MSDDEQTPEPEAPEGTNPEVQSEQPEPAPPVTLKLSHEDGRTVEVRVPDEVATAILEYGAPALVYLAGPGDADPDALRDEFTRSRQHTMNAVHELQNAALAHPLLSQRGEVYSHAHQVAFQSVALVYNMLVQAGVAVREQAEMMARYQEAAEAEAKRTVDGDTSIADLKPQTDAHGGTILG